jgi:hypothetical protein
MNKYYITFGQKYRTEEHPELYDAHPDALVLIQAPDKEIARVMAFERLGHAWSFLYEEGKLDMSLFPRGIILTLIAEQN